MSAIEALYIFDEHNTSILSHVWNGRPPSPQVLLPLYLAFPFPRPSLIYESNTNPPTLVHSIVQDRLLFLCPASSDTDPLAVLEFLHRVADAFEDFLGSPLLASKISTSYDVLAQLLGEMCDCGAVASTEPNALRDLVEAPTLFNKLLGGVGLPSSSPSLSSSPTQLSSMMQGNNNAPAIPWRRNNVRHTSNELYVDILETLHVITAPSGQPLAAFAHGSVIFTAKVSGIPDLFLSLGSQAGGPNALASTLSLPVFHPCVRLARWKEKPGELSFVPPDGRFLLMGYEVDLLGPEYLDRVAGKGKGSLGSNNLHLPATVAVRTGLGSKNADFEVRLSLDPKFASKPGGVAGARGDTFNKAKGLGSARSLGTSAQPTIEDVVVEVPIPTAVRNVSEMKPSKGEARWAPGEDKLEWRISGKEIGTMFGSMHSSNTTVVATLRCTVVGASEETDTETEILGRDKWEYEEDESAYQSGKGPTPATEHPVEDARNRRKDLAYRALMPSSASVSFQIKGWLASGLRVDKMVIDAQRSRGLGAGVQPYKGVKYLTVSREGVETRC